MCAYKVIITKRQIKIEKVVTTPNLVRGSKEPNAKLKKKILADLYYVKISFRVLFPPLKFC